jgi:hypothetical protein
MSNQHLCERCKLLTLEDLYDRHAFSDAAYLIDQTGNVHPCLLCSLIFWSLRFDRRCLQRFPGLKIYLLLNPPPRITKGRWQWVEVVATRKDIAELAWAPRKQGEPWHFGPPDYNPEISRGRLTIFAGPGE